jgi:DNA transposition AAA+ family ATPase
MSSSNTFPVELLTKSVEERVKYFDEYRVAHRSIKTALEKTKSAVSRSAGPRVVIVTGPTGVGKTTLARNLFRAVVKGWSDEIDRRKDFIPVLYGNAIAPNGAAFNWKDFYIRLLQRSEEPLVHRKLLATRQRPLFSDQPISTINDGKTCDVLRRAVEECMRRRGTKVLIIDEAHHILMVNDEKRMEFQFEAIKSLAIETGATIVLIGTYRLLDIRDMSGQLVRRSEIVHLPRYDIRIVEDQSEFFSVLNNFQRQLPLRKMPDLMKFSEFFYHKTGGGIGILKDWLTQCLEKHLRDPLSKFDRDFIEQNSMSNKALKTIIEEAMVGEEKLADIPIDELETLLNEGLPKIETPKEGKGKKKKTVGSRNPMRDPVGGVFA